jgi:threonine dehydrogenase-like Zn-dependent dehydrogenase
MQAEKVRVPYASVTLVKVPDEVTDEQALMIPDIFPTAWFGAKLAEIGTGDTVVVFGCGPVGIFSVVSARLMGAGRVLAVDEVPDRLEMARRQGAEVIDFSAEDPIDAIHRLTGGIGPDRVIDAVGIDAVRPHRGPAEGRSETAPEEFDAERAAVAPETNPAGDLWNPGDAPSMALRWGVRCIAKAGTLSIIGVYPPEADSFPIGEAMQKNLTIKAGNCNHRAHIPELLELVRSGAVDPATVLTQIEGVSSSIEAYEAFDRREPGWVKVELEPTA